MKTITKDELEKLLAAGTNGIFVIYGACGTGKSTFIRKMVAKYCNIGVKFPGKVTKPILKRFNPSKEIALLVESNQLPTKGAEELIEAMINFDDMEIKP